VNYFLKLLKLIKNKLFFFILITFDNKKTYEIKLENANYELKLQEINEVEVNLNNYDDPLSIQILDLIFTHRFNYR
jgi:hypothetical protein